MLIELIWLIIFPSSSLMLSLREPTDDDGKTQQISSSVFPEFSDLYLYLRRLYLSQDAVNL